MSASQEHLPYALSSIATLQSELATLRSEFRSSKDVLETLKAQQELSQSSVSALQAEVSSLRSKLQLDLETPENRFFCGDLEIELPSHLLDGSITSKHKLHSDTFQVHGIPFNVEITLGAPGDDREYLGLFLNRTYEGPPSAHVKVGLRLHGTPGTEAFQLSRVAFIPGVGWGWSQFEPNKRWRKNCVRTRPDGKAMVRVACKVYVCAISNEVLKDNVSLRDEPEWSEAPF